MKPGAHGHGAGAAGGRDGAPPGRSEERRVAGMTDHDQLDQALVVWQMGERFVQWQSSPGSREDYERAVAIGLARLQACTTIDELLAHYAARRWAGGTDDWWESACRAAAHGHRLNAGIVEDAAYWRRVLQLLGHPDN